MLHSGTVNSDLVYGAKNVGKIQWGYHPYLGFSQVGN